MSMTISGSHGNYYAGMVPGAKRAAGRETVGENGAAVRKDTVRPAGRDIVEITGRVAVEESGETAREPVGETAEKLSEAEIWTTPAERSEEKDDEPEGENRETVAFNAAKRARMLAAARTPEQVRQVLALLDGDLRDCKAGVERGACTEEEVAKVQAMIGQANAKLAQVAGNEDEEEVGLSAFDLAALM